ncbi:MAG: MazG family protein [Desulfuromonadaceae bacterium]|jgi:tetrapyrrole methylase family protein / MazG family protein
MPKTPPIETNSKDAGTALNRLLDIMARLRSPEGCPWDAEQTPESLKPYLVEETYEVLDALDRNKPAAIREELGDLLLQIVFHARIFEERGLFSMADVVGTIVDKLIRRHPHVFNGVEAGDAARLRAQWDRIKAEEQRTEGKSPSIPRQLPALQKATKLANKTFPGTESREELQQLALLELQQLATWSPEEPRDILKNRFASLLFTLARMGNALQIDSEDALRQYTNRLQEEQFSDKTDA